MSETAWAKVLAGTFLLIGYVLLGALLNLTFGIELPFVHEIVRILTPMAERGT